MSRGSGTSSEQACSHTWEYCRVSKRILSASMSTASCSSPKELTQAVLLHEAVRTLKAICRHVHGELLIPEGVDAGRLVARGGAHLEGDLAAGLAHGAHELAQGLVAGGLDEELLERVPQD